MNLDNLRKHMRSTIGILCPFVDNSPCFSIEMLDLHSHRKGIKGNSITVNNSGLLSNIFYNLYNGQVSVSNSKIINSMLYKYHNDQQMPDTIKKCIDLNCASILLPNLSNATFDEILELKHKAKDELIELRSFIELLNVNYDVENMDNINDIIINKINPSIRNFEYKIKDIKINVAQKFITEIKNPFSYAPLLGTIFANVPQYISLMFSSALIGADVGLEYLKQLNNIKKDNMYFLFKLHKII